MDTHDHEPGGNATFKPFGTYRQRGDGTGEFRRTGETSSPGSPGDVVFTLYSGPPLSDGKAEEIAQSEFEGSVAPTDG